MTFDLRKTISFAFAIFFIFTLLGIFSAPSDAHVIGTVPNWNSGSGADFAPQSWPSDPQWKEYTLNGSPIIDPRVLDPSNGGTRPQNYVNISSGCDAARNDMVSPSVYFYYANNTLFFRWRVEQIANNYGTGPGPGQYSTVNPWWAAQWTVMFDIDGDGYREFAMQLDGSTGMPSQPIDILRVIYSNTLSQNMDPHDRGITEIAHNPTGFVNDNLALGPLGQMLNFHNTNTPDSVWANGPAETVWDYGTTRAVKIDHTACGTNAFDEYFLDYQIPLPMINNGVPQYNCAAPAAFLFATANSLTNPFQKDVVGGDTAYVPTPDQCAAFGDQVILCGPSGPEIIPQPVVDSVTTSSNACSVSLTATVRGSMNPGTCTPNISSVEFFRYLDSNANGQADDSSSWVSIGTATISPSNPGQWTMNWDASGFERGEYLIGVKATNSSGKTTWSWYTTSSGSNYANPSTPGVVYGSTLLTNCGGTTTVDKTANLSFVPINSDVVFTITVHNNTGQDMTVTGVTDYLPQSAGGYTFTYKNTVGGTLAPSGAPATSGTQVTWSSFTSPTITDGSSKTLIFTATAPNNTQATGSYSNTCSSAVNAWGAAHTINCNYVEVEVGAPDLTIAKSADVNTANVGDTITYTITYSNNSMVGVTNAVLTDPLPLGITYVNGSASNGGTYDSGTRTITWNIGAITSQSGPFTRTFQATVDSPYPQAAQLKLLNPATICSTETSCKSASVTVYITNVSRPRLSIEKLGNKLFVDASAAAPANQVIYTISFANSGNTASTNTTITDVIPRGWTFVSAAAGTNCSAGTNTAGTVSWTITTAGQAAGTLLAGSSGTCNLVLQAYYQNVNDPYNGENPSTNTATIQATGVDPVSSSFKVGVVAGVACPGVTYYYHSATANVGYDGTQEIANTIFPTYTTSATNGMSALGNTCASGNYNLIHAFYEDPASVNGIPAGTAITSKVWMQKTSGNPAIYRVSLYDYNPASPGTKTLIGQTSTAINGSDQSGPRVYLDSITTTGALIAGHRLYVVYDGCSQNNQTLTYTFYYDGTPEPSQYCSQGYNVVMDKVVDKITALPGDTLNYTITFGNIGSSDVTGAQIVDTLPTGTTFTGATIQTSAAGTMTAMTSNCPAPGLNQYCANGQTITFNVHTFNNATAGVLTASNQGKLILTATVNNPLPSGIYSLVNNDTLITNQTQPVYGSATTEVPTGVSIMKSESTTMLFPGETITYTLKVLNSTGSAITVNVTDDIPDDTYFTLSGSPSDGGVPSTGGSFTGVGITWSNLVIPASSARSVTFQMVVGSSAVVPLGTTYKDNTGVVTYGTQQYSNTVRVAILNEAKIALTKTVSPAGPVAPGSTVTWSMTVSNAGSQNAYNVQVTDPIPAYTSYKQGTLTYESSPKTDKVDDESGVDAYFDAPQNRVVFYETSGWTLAPAESRTLTFDVTVNDPMPIGTTTISNTATATASNADSRQASASINVSTSVTFTLDKYAPAIVPDPLTTLAANVTNGSVITVAEPRFIAVNDVVSINGTTRTVTAMNGSSITLDGSVTGVTGDNIVPTFLFTFNYQNTGGADATTTTVTDTIPAGLQIISYSSGCSHLGQIVTCTLGTLHPGNTGNLWVRVRPTACGTYLNTGSIQSTELPGGQASNQTTTIVCGLLPNKVTTTPTVSNTSSGTKAMYTITVTNTTGTQATGVQITDNLSSGFSYDSTYAPVITESGAARVPDVNPTNAQHPAWGTWTINSGGSVTIQFRTDVSGYVPAGTYQNNVACNGTNLACLWFDELRTIAEDVTVGVKVNLTVQKTVNNQSNITVNGVGSGAQFEYSIKLINNTAGDNANHAYKVSLKDLLNTDENGNPINPAKLAYISHIAPAGTTYTPATGIWDIGKVDYGQTVELKITAYPLAGTAGSSIPNCANLILSSYPADSNSSDNKSCAYVTPTFVSLVDFSAAVENGKVIVEWETGAELGTTGFYLSRYDADSDEFIQLSPDLLPGVMSPNGGFYKFEDSSARPFGKQIYRLTELEQNGDLVSYGPFEIDLGGDPQAGKIMKRIEPDGTIMITIKGNVAVTTRAADSADSGYEQITDSFSMKVRPPSAEKLQRLAAAQQEMDKTKSAKKTRKGSAMKISVVDNGIYYIDAADISAKMNIPLTSMKSMIKNGQFLITSIEGPVSYSPAKDNAGIYFYGETIDSEYTNENIYWLTQDKGTLATTVDGGKAVLKGNAKDYFTETLHLEKDLVPAVGLAYDPDTDYWYWDYIMGGYAAYDTKNYKFTTPSVSAVSGSASVTLRLMGGNNTAAALDHHTVVSLNGKVIGEGRWDGMNPYEMNITIAQNQLSEAGNTLTVKAVRDKGVTATTVYIDSFDVTYSRRYEAAGNVLSFGADGSSSVEVSKFVTPDISLYEITDPLKPKTVTSTVIEPYATGYRLKFSPASAAAKYIAIAGSAISHPNTVSNLTSDLKDRSNAADYIVIAPEELKDAANQLADYRKSKGLTVKVALVENIMDEFNNGMFDPGGIKKFLAYAYGSWRKAPTYAVLMGEGNYDYKNALGYGGNLLPPLMVGAPIGILASDSALGDINGDGDPKILIGRLPVLNTTEFATMLSKIKAAEAGTNDKIMFVADIPDSAGDFSKGSDELSQLVGMSHPVQKIYLSNYPIAQAKTLFIEGLNQGAHFLNYQGHGSQLQLSKGGLVKSADIAALTNSTYPFLTALTCSAGNFAIPGYDSIVELFVIKSGGGMVSSWAPTSFSYDSDANALGKGFYQGILQPDVLTIGDAVRRSVTAYRNEGRIGFMLKNFNIIGDPALRIK